MNLYVRYFESEFLAKSPEEAVAFLHELNDFKVENGVLGRLKNFLESSNLYPYRLKVSFSNYVLFLKTEAENLEQFHEFERQRKDAKAEGKPVMTMAERKKVILDELKKEVPGWYEASLVFKRVVPIPNTPKFQYVDTIFRVLVKAQSAHHCYERIIDHLQHRKEIDPRSQFPSSKSNNFTYKYLGEEIPNK